MDRDNYNRRGGNKKKAKRRENNKCFLFYFRGLYAGKLSWKCIVGKTNLPQIAIALNLSRSRVKLARDEGKLI